MRLPAVFLTCLVSCSFAAASGVPVAAEVRPDPDANSRPNIIVVLSDDMGYSDIGCYGGEIRTPTLDRLAANGLRFTQFYNTARCCPTRASLLTGLYPHQAGIGWMMEDSGHDGYRGDLNRNCRTIAEVLRPAGYSTYAVGKWHVTKQIRQDGDQSNWPLQRGFDRFYGTIHGAGSFFDPNSLTRGNTQISPYNDPEYQPEQYYYTDAISDHAVRFLTEHTAADKTRPFFMYVAYTAAHWPMHALPEDIAEYKARYDVGYGPIREQRLNRMRQLGLIPEQTTMSAQAENWDEVEHKAWESRCMEVYAAMVDRMDQGIGRIVSALEQHNQLDRTLILFLQDNGGCAEGLGRRPGSADKFQPLTPMSASELQPDMIPKKSRDGHPVRQGPSVMPGPADTYIAYGRGWANVSNTPFREYKHWVHEGGISTPLIAHWPDGIRRTGELEHQPGHLIDVMATCIDLAGAEYPRSTSEGAVHPPEGLSLKPTFTGEQLQRRAIFWEHEGNRAVRQGDWKLVAKGRNGPWELYNIAEDRSEQTDLAATEPMRVRLMSADWNTWAENSNAFPLTPYYADRNKVSSKKRFRFAPGSSHPRSESPAVAGRGFRIRVQIREPGTEGVLFAHGGDAHGYALYGQDGRLRFTINRGGKLTTVSGRFPDRPGDLLVTVTDQADVKVETDTEVLLEGRLAGLLASMPADGFDVGTDTAGTVGTYESPHRYNGRLGRVLVELD